MTILVTGASGRIGRAVVARLLRQGFAVRGLDRTPSSTAALVGDLCSPAVLDQALHGVQAVVHTAALHAPQVGHVPDETFWQVNLAATQQLWRRSVDQGVTRWVFTSTTALYGDAVADALAAGYAAWLTEATPPRPRTVYHHSKLAAEQWLTQAAQAAGAPRLRLLRVSRCFPEPVTQMAVYRLHRGIDVRDVARAHVAALVDDGPAVRCCNVSAATPFRPEDTAALADDAPAVLRLRAPALVAAFAQRGWPLPARIDRVVDPALAADQLGWQSGRGWDELLRQWDDDSPELLPP